VLQSAAQQAKANFEKLQQDVQAGNLAGAQQAFAALQQNGPLGQTNPLQKQIDALGQALQSGNVASAQQALTALQAAAQSLGGQSGRGGGSGAGGGGSGGAGGSSSSSKTVVSQSSTTSASGVITTVVTYSNGSQATVTSYGPAPASTQSILV
jgi:hypothetical protein